MTRHHTRGVRRNAGPLGVLLVAAALAVSGCSGGSHPAATNQGSPPPSASATTDSAATAALSHAEAVTAATKSFSFNATEVLSGSASHATTVQGTVVRGVGVSYQLTTNGRTSQVVRLKTATYLRPVPGHWSKLRKPTPVTDPAGTLVAVLSNLTGTSLKTAGTSQIVQGQLTPTGAAAAQLPKTSGPSGVQVTIDAAGHVTKLTITAQVSGTTVTLTTIYSAFDATTTIKAPL